MLRLLASLIVLVSVTPAWAAPIPQMYFGSSSMGGGLARARLDGSALQFVLPADGTFINAVAVDWVNERVYYSPNAAPQGIYVAELGGANPTVIVEGMGAFDYLAVDPAAGVIAGSGTMGVILAGLDGQGATPIEEEAQFDGFASLGVDVDPLAGEVCYGLAASLDRLVIRCRAYDATAPSDGVTVFDTGAGEWGGFSVLWPVAVDPIRRQIWHGENGDVHRTDRDTLVDSDITATLPSYSGRALAIDALGGKLYYRGSLNTVRVIDVDLTNAVELLDEDAPSISRDLGLLVPPPFAITLDRLVTLPVGDPDCPDGGVRVEVGDDDGDPAGEAFNGELEPEEVDTVVNVCAEGAGTSCSVADNGDGSYTLTCPDGTSVTWSDGEDGINGTNGVDGSDGDAGAGGDSCTVTDNGDGSAVITCDDGSSATVGGGGGCTQSAPGEWVTMGLLALGLLGRRRRRAA